MIIRSLNTGKYLSLLARDWVLGWQNVTSRSARSRHGHGTKILWSVETVVTYYYLNIYAPISISDFKKINSTQKHKNR